jgi:hypothetical protein
MRALPVEKEANKTGRRHEYRGHANQVRYSAGARRANPPQSAGKAAGAVLRYAFRRPRNAAECLIMECAMKKKVKLRYGKKKRRKQS